MACDVTAAIIGYLLGSTIGIVTVAIAFALGPCYYFGKRKDYPSYFIALI